ncbi:hypothetical protein ACPUEN_01150 [Algoriphagus yeomjeoni]|uniref:hypothetical protein n=1 Tax=Algoriphagus yeomjeoni TaxID=291403 RepID=UPI003CE4AD7F
MLAQMFKPFLLVILFCLSQNSFSQCLSPALFEHVLAQLDVEEDKCFMPLVSCLEISNEETVLVIPEIEESGEGYVVLNSHILVVNSANGAIKSCFYKEKAWLTDALKINSLEIRYQPYKLNSTSETLGIIIEYEGSSSVFPSGIEELSLYERKGEEINLLLENFELLKLNGDTDGMTNGLFEVHNKAIEPSSVLTNGYFDLMVKDSVTNYQLINGEEKNINKKLETEVLIFENGEYRRGEN